MVLVDKIYLTILIRNRYDFYRIYLAEPSAFRKLILNQSTMFMLISTPVDTIFVKQPAHPVASQSSPWSPQPTALTLTKALMT